MTLVERLQLYIDNVQGKYTERFENAAERFYQKTGMLAPGKSVPLGMPDDFMARDREWTKFQNEERDQFVADLRVCIERCSSDT